MISKNPRIGFIGFGEVAYHFSKGLKEDGIQEIFAFDKNAKDTAKGEIVRRRARDAGVQLVPCLRQLVGKKVSGLCAWNSR